jgi:hypothetical protein
LDYGDDRSVSSEINCVVKHRQNARVRAKAGQISPCFPINLYVSPATGCISGWSWAGSECYEAFGGTVGCNERDGAQGRSVKIEPWEAVFEEVSTLDEFMMGADTHYYF